MACVLTNHLESKYSLQNILNRDQETYQYLSMCNLCIYVIFAGPVTNIKLLQ